MKSYLVVSLFAICANNISSTEVEKAESLSNSRPDEQRTVSSPSKRWLYNFVSYTLDQSYNDDDRRTIISAMDEIERNTCISWFETSGPNLPNDYISIKNSGGCETDVLDGKVGGEQSLSLEISKCKDKGLILHLLLHTLGIKHEHQRHDRDDYIFVHWDNIIDGLEHKFAKYASAVSNTLDLDYNYRSVMHYNSHKYAKNKSLAVLSPRYCDVEWPDLGAGLKNGYLTKLDIQNINKYYDCPSNT